MKHNSLIWMQKNLEKHLMTLKFVWINRKVFKRNMENQKIINILYRFLDQILMA